MRFNGEWLLCDDGFTRPVIRAGILSSDGIWLIAEFLIDTGADRTVISAGVLRSLRLQHTLPEDQIGGVGGLVESVEVRTQIRLTRDDGEHAKLRGTYAACMNHAAMDMSVLGRDILDLFAVIVDRPADAVAIVGGNHYYTVHQR